MKTRRAVCLGAVALALAVPAAPARTTAVGVSLREFHVAPYRDRVRPGTVKLNIQNFGEDPHNLVVRTRRGRVLAASGEIRAGERFTLRVRIRSVGRYQLVCTLAGHDKLGMRARLTVSRRARASAA